jgi:transposase InsO family protein
MIRQRAQRAYDHRLVRLVQDTGDTSIATRLGVPRSTAAGWIRRAAKPVTTRADLNESPAALRVRVARLERRVYRLTAVLRILFAVLRAFNLDLTYRRAVPADGKARLLRAVDRSRGLVGLRRILRICGLSPSRLSAWRRAAFACELPDQPSCPHSSPNQVTGKEISTMHEMVTSSEFRHVATGRLAILSQRLGKVFASASTWHRLVRERGWRRPRVRIHPKGPKVGIRATKPNEIFHVDTTVIRLLDGTRAYLHAVIDNFSRRILAWRLADHFDVGNSVAVLVEAGRGLAGLASPPTLVADSGVENVNGAVDELIQSGLLRRVLAMAEINFSNSLIEAWWRCLKHQWLFLNALDSVARVRKLVEFYVDEHNSKVPHAAFSGQTPDEMYFGTGAAVPDQLAAERTAARAARLKANREARCAVCA